MRRARDVYCERFDLRGIFSLSDRKCVQHEKKSSRLGGEVLFRCRLFRSDSACNRSALIRRRFGPAWVQPPALCLKAKAICCACARKSHRLTQSRRCSTTVSCARVVAEPPCHSVSQSATCRQLRSSGGATALGRDKNKLRRNFFTVATTRMKQEALKFAIRGIQRGVANVRSPDQRSHE